MAEKRRLGRGLDSLIPAMAPEPSGGAAPQEIPLRQIELNPRQPRDQMDAEELERLADSIRASGLIQPVVVRRAGTDSAGYELVVGERRVRAARLAGMEAVPAVVRDVPDDEMLELALVENIQRADLNAMEKARAIRRMMAERALTQEEVGRRLGMDRSTIANLLRLLGLPEEVQQMVSRGTLSAGHARAVLMAENPAVRVRLANTVASQGLSVRDAERLAVQEGGPRRTVRIRQPSPNVVQLEEGLSQALGTRVAIKLRRTSGGKIVIQFRDHDDFERLYEALTGRPTTEFPERIPA